MTITGVKPCLPRALFELQLSFKFETYYDNGFRYGPADYAEAIGVIDSMKASRRVSTCASAYTLGSF